MVALIASGYLALVGCSAEHGVDTSPEESLTAPASGTVNSEDVLFQARMIACLAEAGILAEVTEGGGIGVETPVGQEEAYRVANQRCAEELGYTGTPAPPDEETLRDLYPQYVVTIECLEANGYDPDPPVSETVFVEGPYNANPYAGIDLESVDPVEMLRVCPEPQP